MCRYVRFIESCQEKNTEYTGYTEKHHICPKASDMFPDYSSFREHPWNYAILKARQHFIAHIILWKVYPTISSVLYATWAMKHKNNLKINSKLYEELSKNTRQQISIIHKDKTPWNKEKKGIYSEETLQKMSESKTGTSASPETLQKLRIIAKERFEKTDDLTCPHCKKQGKHFL